MAGAHDSREGMPSSPAVRKALTWVMVPLVVATVAVALLLWPQRPDPPENTGATFYNGRVTSVLETACPPDVPPDFQPCGEVTVLVEEGPDTGQEASAPLPSGPGAVTVRAGDKVVLSVITDPGDPSVRSYNVADQRRGQPLFLLVVLFAVVIVAFGLLRGLASLAGLAACFTLLLLFVLPGIISGHPPLLVAVVGAALVMFVIMYLVHGISVRTSVAVLGTLGALIVTGLLGVIASAATHLTGFVGSDEMGLFFQVPGIDLRGVLLAGIIIGSLGVLDDVTISQSATVSEISRANPRLSRWQLYRAGTRVGRAHIASVVNTLVLAYAGASLPVLLLIVLSGAGAGRVLTAQVIAQEIVRSVVATIGLVAAVPLTTALAAFVCASARAAALAGASGPPATPAGWPDLGQRDSGPGDVRQPGQLDPGWWEVGQPDPGQPEPVRPDPAAPPAPEPRPTHRPRHRRPDAGEALAPENRPW